MPHRRLRAGARIAQTRGQTLGGVLESIAEPSGFVAERRKQGQRQPRAQERLNAHTGDVGGQCFVGNATLRTLGVVFDACGGSNEYQGLHQFWVRQRQLQAQPAAH